MGRADALRSVVRTASRRERAGIIAVGPPGVGRTRFARAALVAVGSTGPGAGHPSGPSWHQVWVTTSTATTGIPLGALSHLLPELDPGDGSPGRLLHEARQVLLRQRGQARLLLGVDDVHLLDETSAVLLHQLASSGDAFLILSAPTGVTVPDPVFALWKEALVERVDLPELTRRQNDELVVEVLGGHVDGASLARLWDQSLGNPLFLRELVRGARASGALHATGQVWHSNGPIPIPPRLSDIVRQRTEGLATAEQSLLRLLAFGQPLGTDLATGLTSSGAVAALEERGLIVSQRTGRRVEVSLAHPLHASVLRRIATPYQERQTYQRLADALEARGVRREEDRWRLLAWRTGQGAWTDPAELVSAADDVHRLDPGLAERLLREAASSGSTTARLAHARILVRLGRSADADLVLDGLAEVEDLDRDQELDLAVARGYNRFWGLRDVVGACDAIGETVDDGSDTRPRAVALRGFALLLDGRHEDAAALVEPVLESAEGGEGGEDPIVAVAVAATAALRSGRADEARRHAERALTSRAEDPTGGWLPVEMTAVLWFADLEQGLLDQAEERARSCHSEAIAAGHGDRIALYATWLGIVAARRGRVRTAARWLFEAAAGVSADRFLFAAPLVSELAMALSALGEHQRARSVFDEAGEAGLDGPVAGWSGAARVWLAGAAGHTSEATRIALEVADSAVGQAHRVAALHTAVRLGITGAVVDRLAGLSAAQPGALNELAADHGRALSRADGHALDDVADRFAGTGLFLHAAEAAAQAAGAHRAASQLGSAGGSASRARAWADRCEGASTPALDALEGAVDLTRREMEIASLAASGLTSKAIASQLVVSVRTVDNVLRMVYAKLGVSGRGDLAQVTGIRRRR